MNRQVVLFDDVERIDGTPRRNAEDGFSFLNRAGADHWGRVRDALEEYFTAYPNGEAAKDLRNRFRSDKPTQHLAAWWELYLFTLYSKLGYTLAPHPIVPNSDKRPDFLVSRGTEHFYLEAVAVFPQLEEDAPSNKLDASVLDIVNKGYNPNFMVGVEFVKHGSQLPREIDIVRPLETWLGSLDVDKVLASVELGGDNPRTNISAGDWTVAFYAYPLSQHIRGEDHRLLGVYPAQGGIITDEERVRKATRRKANRYGKLDAPLVVAVMSLSPYTNDEIAQHALFGSLAYQYVEGHPGTARWIRLRNGLFTGEQRPRATNVSAVLLATEVLPWNHARAVPRLWLNPWSDHPIENVDGFAAGTSSPQGVVSTEEGNLSMSQLLGLDAGWPGTPS